MKTGLPFDETHGEETLDRLATVFVIELSERGAEGIKGIAETRQGEFLTHEVFHRHRSEHEMLRYLRRLAERDLALDRTMIPLGSCTMKLNATTEMLPVTMEGLPDAPVRARRTDQGLPRIDLRFGVILKQSPGTPRSLCSPMLARKANSPGCSQA